MSLSDRLKSGPVTRISGTPCSVGSLLRALPDNEAKALEQMLEDAIVWSGAQIYEAVRAEGLDVGRQSIGRHRRKQCRCFRDPSVNPIE